MKKTFKDLPDNVKRFLSYNDYSDIGYIFLKKDLSILKIKFKHLDRLNVYERSINGNYHFTRQVEY
jgi:hypothetical protein